MSPTAELSPQPTSGVANSAATRRALLRISALLLVLFVVASAALVQIALEQNTRALEQGRFYVEKASQARQKSILATISDNAFWGDAYRNLHASVDLEWAYTRQNLGPSLFEDFAFEGLFVVAANGTTAYAVVDGQRVATSVQQWLQQDITDLLAQAREQAGDGEPVVGFVQIAGQPALVAAAGITPGGDPQIVEVPGPKSVLLFVDLLGPDKLQALGESFGIDKLQMTAAATDAPGAASLPLATLDGESVLLRWQPARPGDQLLYLILPLLALAGSIFALVTWLTLRRAMAAAREMDASYASLYASQRALLVSETRFRDVAEAASDWIWEVDAELRLTYLSARFQAVTGHAESDWLGRPLDEFIDCPGGLSVWLNKRNSRASSGTRQCHYRARDGRLRTCRLAMRAVADLQVAAGYRGTVSDITEEVEARARIEHLSLHDALTGLPNRNRMQEFLEGKLKAVPRAANPLVMLSLDLDRFKPVNDSFGHAVGDQVLNEVSWRLRQCLRDDDLVARMGGDEFILIVSGISTQEEVEHLCGRLVATIEQPFEIDNHSIFIGTSIGIAMAPADATLAEELLRYADIALYEAKGAGRNTWRFYASDMHERALEQRQLESDLRQALQHDELRLLLQPRYSVKGKRMVAAEALVRWQHPQRGLLSPDSFISIAETTGLIVPLSSWVLHAACMEAMSWSEKLIVSVNLSSVEFKFGHLVERVKNVLDATGLPPSRLELELTESVLLEDAESALVTMQALKDLGVRLSMDDFGTGYSSLGYLRTFPFDGLKIDRSFMSDLNGCENSQAIIKAIIGLGRALSLTVTAEGVESQGQLDILQQYDCEEAQGYFLDRPMQPALLRSALERLEQGA
ncbi:EAL domain-containing protein [Pseudomonas sp. SA3-5]|uniref:EAL domain-containing protein n=1 Tax=Pseudomonas aestuarii TaxID=3018340 RepID=A0ABT4XGN4_9PSED|nr:EAL domain-containing protein [Pseudomonas aestuarii]MDA7087342.1 EAL domain-containing protein [Pseudomonas aestuarii]